VNCFVHGLKDDALRLAWVQRHHVEVAGDLRTAKFFVSIFGSEMTARKPCRAEIATPFVKGELGPEASKLRRTLRLILPARSPAIEKDHHGCWGCSTNSAATGWSGERFSWQR